MNVSRQKDRKIMINSSILVFLCILTILLPFNALINTFFTEKLGISVLKFWKEVTFISCIVLTLLIGGFRKWSKKWLNIIGFTFIGLVFLYSLGLGFGMNMFRVLRLETLPMVCLIGFTGMMAIFNTEQKDKIGKFLLYGGVLGVAAGALFMAIFGEEGLTLLGYRMDWSTFYTGEALAFCQKIENTPICRFQGFLSGPNQMGVYLNLLGAILISRWNQENRFVRMGILIVLIGFIILTFSRSSLLAFITMITVFGLIKYKDTLINHWKGFIGLLLSLGLMFGVILYEPARLYFSRPESNSERLRLMTEGLDFWRESLIFGKGAGSIGPVSRFVTDSPLIPENWLLQVAGQFGLIGLILFVAWYISVILSLYNKKSFIGVGLMIGLLIPLNLLHTFEAAAFVYGLSIFLALELDKVQN